MDSILCPYSGHQRLMSGIWSFSLSMLRTSKIDVRNQDRYFVPLPDITFCIPDIIVRIPDITVLIPDITVLIPDINSMQNLMSGI